MTNPFPREARDMSVVRAVVRTPFGVGFAVGSDGEHIVEARFVRNPRRVQPRTTDALLSQAIAQFEAYLAKRLERFDLPLAFDGPPFVVEVWRIVAALRFGEVVSYADVARAAGRPLAHRAVAMAMGRAPYDLLVPAHRVVGADGRIKGAAAGSMRRKLLLFEGSLKDARRDAIRW